MATILQNGFLSLRLHTHHTVLPSLLIYMPLLHHMAQLVHNSPELIIVLPDGNGLRSVASLSDKGEAATQSLSEHDPV